MKGIRLGLMLACNSCLLMAQSIQSDATFGINGRVETDLIDQNLNPYGYNLALLPDEEVIIVGDPYGDSLCVKKYRNDGTLDVGFTTPLAGFTPYIFGASIQQDGKAIVSGPISQASYHTAVARLNIQGGLDTTFGNNGISSVFIEHAYESQVLELSNGKIIVFGSENNNTSNIPTVVTRLNSNGIVDSTFGINGTSSNDINVGAEFIPSGVEQADGKLLFAGMASYRLLLFRLNPDGSIDSTFSEDGIVIDPMPNGGEAYCMDLQSDGKIVVGGYSTAPYKPIIARYNPNGTRDSTFGNAGVHYFTDLAEFQEGVGIEVLPNGEIIMLIADLGGDLVRLAQLLPDGQRDPSFGNNGIYQYPGPGLRPRSLRLSGNKITISGRKDVSDQIFLLRFLLDLSIGTLNPGTPADPSLWIYPNPISEQFTLQFGLVEPAPVSVQLFDMQGKLVQNLVQNQSFERGEHALSLSCPAHLPAGNYVMTLEVAGKKMTSVQIMKK